MTNHSNTFSKLVESLSHRQVTMITNCRNINSALSIGAAILIASSAIFYKSNTVLLGVWDTIFCCLDADILSISVNDQNIVLI